MLAKRLPTIIPPLTLEEALETTKINSVAGKIDDHTSLMTKRPFRSPHHTISDVALVGGCTFPQSGEISLGHNGVLFHDEGNQCAYFEIANKKSFRYGYMEAKRWMRVRGPSLS
jgi:predicted ATPase with chaperone activity